MCSTLTVNHNGFHAGLKRPLTSIDGATFLKQHNFEHSMSRGGNRHDKPRSKASSAPIAESLFNLLKHKRVRPRICKTRDDVKQDVFDYIDMFGNPQRKDVRNGMLTPAEVERQQKMNLQGGKETRSHSNRRKPFGGSTAWPRRYRQFEFHGPSPLSGYRATPRELGVARN